MSEGPEVGAVLDHSGDDSFNRVCNSRLIHFNVRSWFLQESLQSTPKPQSEKSSLSLIAGG